MTNSTAPAAIAVDCSAAVASYEVSLSNPLSLSERIDASSVPAGSPVRFHRLCLSSARLYRDLGRFNDQALVVVPLGRNRFDVVEIVGGFASVW